MFGMVSSTIFLFIALFSGAGACISFAAYKHAKTAASNTPSSPLSSPPPPDDFKPTGKVKGRDLKKAVEEAVKPHLEQTAKLEKKLADAETLIKDLKVASRLAPDSKADSEKSTEADEAKPKEKS
jgi:hypothetical protein